jgi:hypothetical protein
MLTGAFNFAFSLFETVGLNEDAPSEAIAGDTNKSDKFKIW